MKLEQTEKLFVETLIRDSINAQKIKAERVLDLDRLTGDASTRRYYRATTDSGDYVICLDDPLAQGKPESNFVNVQRLMSKNGVRVPFLYDMDFSKGYLLEEDLGDETLLRRLALVGSTEEELALYQKSLEQMIKIHRISAKPTDGWVVTTYAFDHEKLMWEMNFTLDYFLNRLLKVNISDREKLAVQKTLSSICGSLSSEKMVVTHRDYHSRNIMLKGDDQIVIDFQDARLGIPQYDLVSLLEDAYYQINDNNKRILKEAYWTNFLKAEGDQSYEKFEYLYDLMAFQRVFKAIGSFAYIYAQRKDIRYLKYVGFGMEKIKTILLKHKDFTELRKVLVRAYYEN